MEDRRCTFWTVAITVASIGLALVYCTLIFGLIHKGPGWFAPPDAPMLTNAGNSLMHGHLSRVYSANRELYALPLAFPLAGLDVLIVNALHLRSAPDQQWIFVEIPIFIAVGAPVLQGARRLAWELGVRRHLWGVQLVTAFIVFVPEVRWGHVEDVLALAFAISAVRRLIRGDGVRACVYLSLAVSSKQWAVMLVPFFILATPRSQRRAALIAAVALPAVLAGLFLVVDFHSAWRAFTSPVTQVANFPGHPWIAPNWLGARTSSANRCFAAVLACCLAWFRRRSLARPTEVVTTVGLILMLRPLTESINYCYYWSPGLLVLTLVAVAESGRPRIADWLWPVLAMAWTLPVSNDVTALDWWAGEAVLLAVIGYRVVGVLGLRKPRWSGEFHSGGRRQTAQVAR